MPQQKKTAPIEATDLPDISEADQEFARLVALGKMSLTDAFRQTRDCSAWQATSIHAQASRHRSNPKIQAWIDAFRTAGVGAAGYTFEQHVAELQRLKSLSVNSGNMGAAVQCEQTIGKAAGLHIERVQEVPHDPVQALKDIAASQPEIAASLAQQAGIAVEDIIPSARTLN
jgi:hypothetical protein